jgi:hypothetical protein
VELKPSKDKTKDFIDPKLAGEILNDNFSYIFVNFLLNNFVKEIQFTDKQSKFIIELQFFLGQIS